MQTNFSLAALADPAIAQSEKILRTCVHCGFCTATCPTYLELGDELDSPRGRIYLIKKMFESGEAANAEVAAHVDRCLSCLSCMTTCPSGVDYMHLIDHARAHIEATYKRPWPMRVMRGVIAQLLPYPGRFRLALAGAFFARPLRPVLARIPKFGPMLGAMLALAPKTLPSPLPRIAQAPLVAPRGRVLLLKGCAQSVLAPHINAATHEVLRALKIDGLEPENQGCCGALVHHMGREHESHAQAKALIDRLIAELDRPRADGVAIEALLITASGCGTTIKDYGTMFARDAVYAPKAQRIAALAKDVTEYLAALDFAPLPPQGVTLAYHSACSMQHGQKLTDLPKNLLKRCGYTVKDVPEGHICCGSAGTYNLLQPELSGRLRARKSGNIAKVKADGVATGNLGCIAQIGLGFEERGETVRIAHSVEWIAQAFAAQQSLPR